MLLISRTSDLILSRSYAAFMHNNAKKQSNPLIMWEEFCTFVLKMSVLRRGEATIGRALCFSEKCVGICKSSGFSYISMFHRHHKLIKRLIVYELDISLALYLQEFCVNLLKSVRSIKHFS